ncbi:transposase [Streptomyces sp. SCSIO 30461]
MHQRHPLGPPAHPAATAAARTHRCEPHRQQDQTWQAKYALRAGVEGTIRQATAVTGNRRTRYRGLGKTHLEHVYSAVALNLIRLDAWWSGQPLDHTRTSHLARLDLTLAA